MVIYSWYRGKCAEEYVVLLTRCGFHLDPVLSLTFDTFRKTCSELYCLYLGPQILHCFLGWHESVRRSPNPSYEKQFARKGKMKRLTTSVQHRQPILADEIQTFKALITIHKVLQEGHPIAIREAQNHVNWLDSLMRGVSGEGLRGLCCP